jgi:Poxvirus A32 protein
LRLGASGQECERSLSALLLLLLRIIYAPGRTRPSPCVRMSFNFSKFDMKQLSTRPACIAVVGMRGTGKSVLLKDMMYHLNLAKVPRCVVFSATEGANGFFASFVPGVFIHTLELDTLTRIWEAQKELKLKQTAGGLDPKTDLRLLIVLDDAAFNRKVMQSNVLKEVYLNGRHYDVTLIVTLQYLIDLNVSMRSNVDVYLFLKELNKNNRERIYKEACGFLPNLKVFEQLFNDATSDYEAFVVNSRCTSSNPEDIVHHYKADATLNYKFGPPCLWRYHHNVFESPQEKYKRQERAKRRDGGKKAPATMTRMGGKSDVVVISRR